FTPTTRVLAASTHSLPCRLPGAGPTSSNPTRLPRPFQHGSAPPASTSRPSPLVPSPHTDHTPHHLAQSLHTDFPRQVCTRSVPFRPDYPPQVVPPHPDEPSPPRSPLSASAPLH